VGGICSADGHASGRVSGEKRRALAVWSNQANAPSRRPNCRGNVCVTWSAPVCVTWGAPVCVCNLGCTCVCVRVCATCSAPVCVTWSAPACVCVTWSAPVCACAHALVGQNQVGVKECWHPYRRQLEGLQCGEPGSQGCCQTGT